MLRGMHGSWRDVVRDRFESHGYVTNKITVRPNARYIDDMRKALEWLLLIDVLDRRVVWGGAEAKTWRRIAAENGITPNDAKVCWQAGVLGTTHQLNT